MDARMRKYRMSRWLGMLFVVFFLMTSWGAQAAVETVPLSFVFSEGSDLHFATTVSSFDAAGCREAEMLFCEKY